MELQPRQAGNFLFKELEMPDLDLINQGEQGRLSEGFR
jgi:hypothetical protein